MGIGGVFTNKYGSYYICGKSFTELVVLTTFVIVITTYVGLVTYVENYYIGGFNTCSDHEIAGVQSNHSRQLVINSYV